MRTANATLATLQKLQQAEWFNRVGKVIFRMES